VRDTTILKTGAIGAVIAAVCCFTPLLVILLGVVGLSAWLGWLDYVLFPALASFLMMIGYGVWRRPQSNRESA
jgi:mercuric ion transport protein